MKRIQYHRYGGPEEMWLELYDLPPPAKNEILVRVKAASVNPSDWKVRQGTMKFMTGRRLPRAMGSDFSDFSGIEQAAAAAGSLEDQARRLTAAVAVFRTGTSDVPDVRGRGFGMARATPAMAHL